MRCLFELEKIPGWTSLEESVNSSTLRDSSGTWKVPTGRKTMGDVSLFALNFDERARSSPPMLVKGKAEHMAYGTYCGNTNW
ncbi:hypothetical protein PGT21_018605 [Puccinia graminis f. sp. tritici]|uniref:Uncharacterized protein n=1 Tax=Puccinia graminis f. sp. tritici TaxID=56615 RepID=A0A5B0MMB1_PUCGR|nr:hypothetical protein PGT21_018605 [Puccinia graminis f. sp. tritici]